MIKINIIEWGKVFSKTMPWQYDIVFKNKTDKTIEYITFYLGKKNTDGSWIHKQTGFGLCVDGCKPGETCYRQITTDWFDPEYGPRDITLYNHAILVYSDGTKEHIYSDEISYGKEKDAWDIGCYSFMIIVAIISCIIAYHIAK